MGLMAVKFEIISDHFCSFIISAATLHYCSAIAHWYDHCVMIAMFALMPGPHELLYRRSTTRSQRRAYFVAILMLVVALAQNTTQARGQDSLPSLIRYQIVLKIESFFRRSTMTY